MAIASVLIVLLAINLIVNLMLIFNANSELIYSYFLENKLSTAVLIK